ESKASHELELKTINAFKQLNWTHLEAAYNRSINVKQCITEHYNMSLAYISNEYLIKFNPCSPIVTDNERTGRPDRTVPVVGTVAEEGDDRRLLPHQIPRI
ncbi:unnamed protein product, partial [Medioppia subpectinata]